MLYLYHRAILFVEPVWRSMSANQHVPGLGDPPNSVLSRPDCAVEDDAVQPVSRDVRAAVVGAQRAHPVPQSAVALLLTEPEKVARFIIPVKARTAGPIGDAWESEELLALTAFVALSRAGCRSRRGMAPSCGRF